MISAFVCSTVFLVFYLYFHFHAGLIRFGGQGWIRPVYFTLLTSHTILAVGDRAAGADHAHARAA